MQTIYRKNAASPWIKQGDRITKTFPSGLCLIQQTYVAPKSLATYNAFVEGAAISDSQPCIDGAYIYPAPDYQDTGDGFMRCTVTAYGRWKTEPNVTRQKRELTLGVFGGIANMPIDGGNKTVYFDQNLNGVSVPIQKLKILADDLVMKFVTPANSDLPLSPPSSMSRIYKFDGEILPAQLDIFVISSIFGGRLQWTDQLDPDPGPGTVTTVGSSAITEAEFESNSPGYNSFGPMDSGIGFKLARCESVEYGHFCEYTASFEAGGNAFTSRTFSFRKK